MNRFDIAAANWDEKPSRVKIPKDISEKIKERIDIAKYTSVLDFGCGTGNLSLSLVEDAQTELIGVDSSQNMLEIFSKKCSELGFVNHIALHHDLEEKLPTLETQLIVSSMTLHHIKNTASLLKNLYSILPHEGVLAIADLFSEDGNFHTHGNDGVHHFGFEKEYLFMLLQTVGFKNIVIEKAVDVNRENGSYEIFLATARK